MCIGIPVTFIWIPGYSFYTRINKVLPWFGAIPFIALIYCLVRCTFMDSGVIPRGDLPPPPEPEDPKKLKASEHPDDETPKSPNPPNENPQEALAKPDPQPQKIQTDKPKSADPEDADPEDPSPSNPEPKKLVGPPEIAFYKDRYCKTCRIYRPPFSSHCNQCDNCIKNIDHHCYFIANCVGHRNHKYFITWFLCIFIKASFWLPIFITIFIDTFTSHYSQITSWASDPTQVAFFIASMSSLSLGLLCSTGFVPCARSIAKTGQVVFLLLTIIFLILSIDWDQDWEFMLQPLLIMFLVCVGFFFFGLTMFMANFGLVSAGMT
jgi:hypothetical protein